MFNFEMRKDDVLVVGDRQYAPVVLDDATRSAILKGEVVKFTDQYGNVWFGNKAMLNRGFDAVSRIVKTFANFREAAMDVAMVADKMATERGAGLEI